MKLNMQMGAAPAAAVVVTLALAPAAPAVAGQHYTAEKDKLLAVDGTADDAFGVDVAIDGVNAIVGAYWDDPMGLDSGAVYFYRYNGTNWVQHQKVFPADGAAGDYFGYSVDIDGGYAVVGAHWDDDNGDRSGSAYVYRWRSSDQTWVEDVKLLANDGTAMDTFGDSVAITGQKVVVGAPHDWAPLSNSGSAYVFEYHGPTLLWLQMSKIFPAGAAASDHFGDAVAMDGNTVVVGSPDYDDPPNNNYNLGAAYTFERNNNGTPTIPWDDFWAEDDKLLASDGAHSDQFAWSVSISGDTIVGGSPDHDHTGGSNFYGSAYVFVRSGATWAQQAELRASDAAADDQLGTVVAISGDFVTVGCYRDDDKGADCGSAYLYHRTGTTWNEDAKIVAADGAAGDWFGVTVDIDGTNVLSGAPLDDDKGAESGSAYVYRVIDPDLCPGDYDQDGVTGFQDLISLLAAWGPCAGCPQDMDGDNAVTFQDLLILLAAWGPCP